MSDRPAIKLDDSDTVVTLLEDADAGDTVAIGDGRLTLETAVPFGHKVAIVAHETGDRIRKYGEVIGAATEPIGAGEWVHTHNAESLRGNSASARAEVSGE